MAIKELFNDSRPQVLFDPRASQRIDPRFKFTRNGPASYYDSQGILRFAQTNQPRVNTYEPDASGALLPIGGLVLEQAETNRMIRSEEFNDSHWVLGGNITGATNVTANQAIAPDETITADLITVSAATNRFGVGTASRTGLAAATTYIFSLFVKAKELDKVWVGFWDDALGLFPLSAFNLSTKTFYGTSYASKKYKSLPNGWYELLFRFTTVAGGRAISILIPNPDGTPTTNDRNASGLFYNGAPYSGQGLYVWGAQLLASSSSGYDYPSSYIRTSASTVTRAPDLLSVETPIPSTGSIYIDAQSLQSDVDTTLLSAAPASPSTDKLALAIRQPASLYNSKALVYEVDGAFKPTLPFPVPSNVRERNLITYGVNNYHYRSDSARYTPSSSTSVPANMTRLSIGHDVTDPTKGFTGYINAVYLWPGEITPTVAEALVRGDVDPKDADAGVFTPAAGSLAFVFNTQGTATDGDTVVQLPLRGSTNNVLVDWGDNTSSSLIGAAASVTVNHTYPAAGIYPVQIEADSDGTNSGLSRLEFYNNSPLDLVRVLQWGGTATFNPTTMYRAFRDCTQMDFETAARTNLPDTSAITDWREAFYGCSSISGLFPSFNLSSATELDNCWWGCSSMTAFAAVGDQTQNVLDMQGAWNGCSGLTSFPLINTSAVTSFYRTWSGCSGLTAFPLLDTGSAINFTEAWENCTSLASFPAINTAAATSFNRAWNNCNSLTSFPFLNSASVTNFSAAWNKCSSLTSFPSLNTSSGTNFSTAWENCSGLTSFPLLDFSSATNLGRAWSQCTGLTSFPAINTSSVTVFGETWDTCSSLTAFPEIDTSSGLNFYQAWVSCSSLTSFPLLDTSAGQSFAQAWKGCSGLTSFPALNVLATVGSASDGGTTYTGFRGAWENCTSLTTFPPNMFDTVASTRFIEAFKNCALTAQSIENILVSINAAGTSNGNLSLEGGTNANTSTWSTAANNAYIALVGRGWTITQNGTAPS